MQKGKPTMWVRPRPGCVHPSDGQDRCARLELSNPERIDVRRYAFVSSSTHKMAQLRGASRVRAFQCDWQSRDYEYDRLRFRRQDLVGPPL